MQGPLNDLHVMSKHGGESLAVATSSADAPFRSPPQMCCSGASWRHIVLPLHVWTWGYVEHPLGHRRKGKTLNILF